MNDPCNKLKYFEEVEKVPREVYYHYTSLEALFSIVQSHTFRLMSLKSSNDRTELYYKPEDFLADVSRLCESEEDENTKRYYSLLRDSLVQNQKLIWKELKTPKKPYALCLSAKKDNLTHWDRYANQCRGVAIGFNVKSLDVLYERTKSIGFGPGLFDIGRALYSQENIDHWIKTVMNRGYDLMRELNKRTPEQSLRQTIEKDGFLFMSSLCKNVMHFVKTHAFCDEDEYRLYFDANNIADTLHLIDLMKNNSDDEFYRLVRSCFLRLVTTLDIRDENFVVTQKGIRGFHNLCLDEIWGSGVIPEIVLGPLCAQNKSELQRFLKQNGLEGTKVTVSSVPIR